MKKTFAAALAAILLASSLAGCKNTPNDSSDNSTSTSTNNTSTDSSTSTDNNTSSDVSTTGKAKAMADAAHAVNPDEWAAMMDEITDPEFLAAMLPGFDTELCADYCFIVDMAGINKHQILVAKAKAGSEDAVKAMFNNYLESLKSPDAMLYPAGMESVEGAAQGETADGYVYLIIHQNGEDIASAMLSEK